MTNTLWNTSVAAIQSSKDAPAWLKEQASLSFEDVKRLPNFDAAADGDDAIPNIEEKLLMADYLDFLREQIKLEPRGPEWGNILKKRLAVLEPFVNKKVITGMFFKKPRLVTLRIDAETGKVIQFETE